MADAALNGPQPSALDRVGVLIVNYNAGDWLRRCVDSVCPDGAGSPAVVIVDNGSRDDSLAGLDRPGVTIDRAGANLGFAAGINRAAARLDREFLLVLNPDAEITPAGLARLVDELDDHPEAVLASGRVVGADGFEQRGSRRRAPTAGRVLAELVPGLTGIDLTRRPAPEAAVSIDAVSGACFLVRATAFRAIGGFDEDYPMHFEDLDLFVRLRGAGGLLRWVPEVAVSHAGGVSSSGHALRVMRSKHRGLARYVQRHIATGRHRWQRPIWSVALWASELLRMPFAWWRDRRRNRRRAPRPPQRGAT